MREQPCLREVVVVLAQSVRRVEARVVCRLHQLLLHLCHVPLVRGLRVLLVLLHYPARLLCVQRRHNRRVAVGLLVLAADACADPLADRDFLLLDALI